MKEGLHGRVLEALTDRSTWEQRQRVWYQMRHDGLRRRRKPYEGAADLHYPLIDTHIDKLKPFYYNQAFASERLAYFISLASQMGEATMAAQEFFDFDLKQRSNFPTELLSVIDHMLMSGNEVCKIRWDYRWKRLVYEAIDPIFFIVPRHCDQLEEADFFVHVKHLTPGQYRRDKVYTRQDEDYVRRITGGTEQSDQGQKLQEKSAREGLTHSADRSIIIVWELYERTEGGWTIRTYSPSAPEEPMRKPFGLPYRNRQGEPILPFVRFPFEVKDKGWYSPRGVPERLAAFESWCCKVWNSKADSLDFLSKPLFTGNGQILNTANQRFSPGTILQGLQPVMMPQPPVSLDEELLKTRMIADELIAMPDAGLPANEKPRERATATEIDYRRALSGQSVDLRGRIFRNALTELYQKSWSIRVQFSSGELSYQTSQERKVLPAQALHDNYQVLPDGSSEQWNKQIRFQKSMSRFQMLAGHPNINQEELVKSLIEEDDARLVKRLFLSNSIKAASEKEDEAMEVLLLMEGYPAAATPNEDHRLRIGILIGKLQQLQETGQPVDPVAKQRITEHLMQHMQFLQQQNPQAAKQLQMAGQMADPSSGHAPESAMGGNGNGRMTAPAMGGEGAMRL